MIAQIIAQFTGERNSDNWGGVKVVAYDEPNVSMGGKLVGGIRVRQPVQRGAAPPVQRQQPQRPAPSPTTQPNEYDEPDNSEIPFS